ncbi:MAG: response regulator transcription factor [Planctomycetes bacterium]|nr:response regulator transcription factor [Planctomycetota bacterium]
MARAKIVVVEDEPDILEVVQYNLEREGHRVLCEKDGEAGLRRIVKEAPDLAILDLMLPGIDGLEICRRLQSDPATRTVPILILTAKAEESDVVIGLGLGADDYVTKPFSPKDLVARVKAILRRAPQRTEAAGGAIERHGLTIDPTRHAATADGKTLTLTPTEFRLLQCLASNPGRAFPRDHLLTRVIGEVAFVTDRNIDAHVRSIRRKLGKRRDLLETVRGVGYRFREESP